MSDTDTGAELGQSDLGTDEATTDELFTQQFAAAGMEETTAPTPVREEAPTAAPAAPADTDATEIPKFQGDPRKRDEAYQELERQHTAARMRLAELEAAQQAAAEPVEEDAGDPWLGAPLPPDLSEADIERLGRAIEQNPVGVARYALERPEWLGEHTGAVINAAAQHDFYGVQQLMLERQRTELEQQVAERYQGQLEPMQSYVQAATATAAEQIVVNQIPNYKAVEPELARVIHENPHYFTRADAANPEALAGALVRAWGILQAQRYVQAASATAEVLEGELAEQPQGRATTQTRSSAPAPSKTDDMDEQIRQSILQGGSPFSNMHG